MALLVYNGRQCRNLDEDMKLYINNDSNCRREILLRSYNATPNNERYGHACCDICAKIINVIKVIVIVLIIHMIFMSMMMIMKLLVLKVTLSLSSVVITNKIWKVTISVNFVCTY